MKSYWFRSLTEILLQMRHITNPKINVATRNIENYILKNLSRKMVQNSFMQQNYSSHKANGKRKFRPYFWSETVKQYIYRDIEIIWIFYWKSCFQIWRYVWRKIPRFISAKSWLKTQAAFYINSRWCDKWVGKWFKQLYQTLLEPALPLQQMMGKTLE